MKKADQPKVKRGFSHIVIMIALIPLVGMLLVNVFKYSPEAEEELYNKRQADLCVPQELTITIWNIGYAGLGKDADFFYDGGRMVRSIQSDVEQNLQQISAFLSQNSADFTLLQEVDVCSKRSYYQNQLDSIVHYANIPYHHFAFTYKCLFVPSPMTEPLGRVQSGLATLGKCDPYQAVRYAYQNRNFSLIKSFMPRYAFLVTRYTAHNGKDVVLVNNHNSAFDKGNLRRAELEQLVSFVRKEYEEGNYIIVGGDWNQTPPRYSSTASTKDYTPYPIADSIVPKGWQWVSDRAKPSMRFCNQPYDSETSLTSVVDFFLVSPNVEVGKITTHNLGFANSDHNPVTIRIYLK
ncbi:MAG: endonuclease/exonuclease/phosphatase family protein [Bacteroidales bacterium]